MPDISGFDLKGYVGQKREVVDQALMRYLPPVGHGYESQILEAMRYSLFAGGKRLRPILCIAGAEAVGARPEDVLPLACSLELIHTYSLIHDDLPAMDDDALRRGKPTNHKVFGEAMAILAGDGLLTEAFWLMAHPQWVSGRDPERVLRVIHMVAEAAGFRGMVGGQAMDMLSQDLEVDLKRVQYIHTHKTGALIRASVVSGAMLMGASETLLACLDAYGSSLGLAFQIWDDVLDVEGDSQEMGKMAGADQKKSKATYPAVLGIYASKQEAYKRVEEALGHLEVFGRSADPLRAIASYVVQRRK